MISRTEILMGREIEYPLCDELKANLERLHTALNKLREAYGKPMIVTSGYRPGHYNKRAGGAAKSAHLTCEACDFSDPHGELDVFCMANRHLLQEFGLWLENPMATPGWCHLDIRERDNRVFSP